MGQWMGLPDFDDYEEYMCMCRRINKANRQDLKAMREAGAEGSFLRGAFTGSHNKDALELESPALIHELMGTMRERFATHVIRRTIDSVDYQNNQLFEMRPYKEHLMKLRMYDWEMDQLWSYAKDLVKENPIASSDTRKVCDSLSTWFSPTPYARRGMNGCPGRPSLQASCVLPSGPCIVPTA